MAKENIAEIIQTSINYIEAEEFKSYDLFDALTNPIINYLTNRSRFLQRVAIQINSKSPISLHWTGMEKKVHTKLISDLVWLFSLSKKEDKAIRLYNILLSLKTKGDYLVWGLNFPYTSGFGKAGSNTPNLYNTSTTGLAICELSYINKKNFAEYQRNVKDIVTSMFNVFRFHDEITKGWFSYYPGHLFPTYNVNALSIYFLCKANNLFNCQIVTTNIIEKIIQLLIKEQNSDGSWYYSRSSSRNRIDGFHTGFIIESLAYVYTNGYASSGLLETLKKAWNYYIKCLFTPEGYPKYYNTSSKFPIESQNYAQAIQTLSLLGMWMGWNQKELLEKVIGFAISNLYDSKGFFYHKKTRYFTYKSSYLRWSTSPMLIALTYAKRYTENKN